MEPDQVGLTLSGVVQAQPGKLAVAWIDVVQVDILHRSCQHRIPGNAGVSGNGGREQEQGRVAHKILDVIDTKLRLYGDVSSTQVVVSVQDVGKAHNLGHVLCHTCELVQNLALSLGQSGLPGGGGAGQRTGVQEGVEVTQHHVLELSQERIVGLLHGDLRAVLVHVLNRNSFGVLLNGDVILLGLYDGGLGIGDHLTGAHFAIL